MKLMDTSSIILFLERIPEYEFLITFSQTGEIMIITSDVEWEYYKKAENINPNYNLDNLLQDNTILIDDCEINDLFKYRYFNLGIGEKSIMSLALEYKKQNKEYYCVLDDNDARKIAKRLGLNLIGSIGLLIKLKEKGLIENPNELVNKIRESTFRISDEILEELNA